MRASYHKNELKRDETMLNSSGKAPGSAAYAWDFDSLCRGYVCKYV